MERGPPPICSACGVVFTRRKSLIEHLQRLSLERLHDSYFSQPMNLERLEANYDIKWSEILKLQLVTYVNKRRSYIPRGGQLGAGTARSFPARVKGHDQRRLPSTSCCNVVDTSSSLAANPEVDVFSEGARRQFEGLVKGMLLKPEMQDLAKATHYLEESYLQLSPVVAQLLAVGLSSTAKLVADQAADYQLVRHASQPDVKADADRLHELLAQWRRGPMDSSVSSISGKRKRSIDSRKPPKNNKVIIPHASRHQLESSCQVILSRSDTLDLGTDRPQQPETVEKLSSLVIDIDLAQDIAGDTPQLTMECSDVKQDPTDSTGRMTHAGSIRVEEIDQSPCTSSIDLDHDVNIPSVVMPTYLLQSVARAEYGPAATGRVMPTKLSDVPVRIIKMIAWPGNQAAGTLE